MSIFNTFHGFVFKQAKRRYKSRHDGLFNRLRFEHLESRQMLSITPGDFPVTGEDTLTAEGLAIDPADAPPVPPFPQGLEDQIEPKLWRVVEVVDEAVDSGDLEIDPESTEPADVDLTNVAVANVKDVGIVDMARWAVALCPVAFSLATCRSSVNCRRYMEGTKISGRQPTGTGQTPGPRLRVPAFIRRGGLHGCRQARGREMSLLSPSGERKHLSLVASGGRFAARDWCHCAADVSNHAIRASA